MKILYSTFIIIAISIFLSACKTEVQKAFEIDIDMLSAKEEKVYNLFDSLEVIPMEAHNDGFVKYALHLVSCDDYYIFLNHLQTIFVFDKQGHFVSSSEVAKGKGHGELNGVFGCTYNKYSKLIEVLTPTAIKFYDPHFQFIKEALLPTSYPEGNTPASFFHYIYDLSETQHLLMSKGYFAQSGKVFFFDSEKGVVYGERSFLDDVLVPYSNQHNCFVKQGDKTLLFPPYLTYSQYILDNNALTLTQSLHYNFGDKELKRSDLSDFPTDSDEDRSNRNKFLRSTTDFMFPMQQMYCNGQMYLHIKLGKNFPDWFYCHYDMATQELHRFKLTEDPLERFVPDFNADEQYIYFAVNEVSEVKACIQAFDANRTIVPKNEKDSVFMQNVTILKYKPHKM